MLASHLNSFGIWRSLTRSARHHYGLRLRPYSTSGDAQKLPLTAIDSKWQEFWRKIDLGKFRHKNNHGESKPPVYVLPMFPYPSGNLHMGHVRVYTISDVVARYNYMRGRDVLHPIGWDAFGLPAENAAIERGLDPADWTKQNIRSMKDQLVAMNGLWDWSREQVTCEPDYYKHNQILFLKLLDQGLAYQKEAVVNWDPVDCTVLANEQVDDKGCSWRSGAKVEQRLLKQWFLKITDFAEDLHSALPLLSKPPFSWPENVLRMQKNWLRKSEGDIITFRINSNQLIESVPVFTTRLDTIFGVQYIALSTDHPIVQRLSLEDQGLREFLEQSEDTTKGSKLGYRIKGITATSPLETIGIETAQLPIYVASYVLPGYGTGSVMGVPAHDQRDFDFWQANGTGESPHAVLESGTGSQPEVYPQKGLLNSNSKQYQGLHSNDAIKKLREDLGLEKTIMWGLRDWLISRQRYWGTPIPIVHCNDCGPVSVPEDQLPLKLPPLPSGSFKGRGGNPLDQSTDWVNTNCPKCSKPAKRETDTMDTFMDSSWYFFRFTDPHNADKPFDKGKAQHMMPVDFYIGGVEHAILHLLYARFMTKFIAKSGLWDPPTIAEPFQKLITQGMVHGKTYTVPKTGRFLKPHEVDVSNPENPIIKATGEVPTITYEKMSKSKYNGVDPQSCIAKYGADATRAHILFQANEREVLEWNEQPIIGIIRSSLSQQGAVAHKAMLNDPNSTYPKEKYTKAEYDLLFNTKTSVKNITQKLEEVSGLNTVVSDLLKLSNALDTASKHLTPSTDHQSNTMSPAVFHHCTSILIRLMAPVIPAWAEESWHTLKGFPPGEPVAPKNATSVFEESWPAERDVSIGPVHSDSDNVVIMINGRRFGEVSISSPPNQLGAEQKSQKHVYPHPLVKWYLEEVLEKTDRGKQVLAKHGHVDIEATRIVRLGGAKGGVLINLVAKKKEEAG
jgi:leucyl-tRNA synthetase